MAWKWRKEKCGQQKTAQGRNAILLSWFIVTLLLLCFFVAWESTEWCWNFSAVCNRYLVLCFFCKNRKKQFLSDKNFCADLKLSNWNLYADLKLSNWDLCAIWNCQIEIYVQIWNCQIEIFVQIWNCQNETCIYIFITVDSWYKTLLGTGPSVTYIGVVL